ncbi:synaptonemal complex central element protein 2 [Pelodytes ibericus]
MSEHKFDATEGQDRLLLNASKEEHASVSTSQVASRPQSPSVSNAAPDLAIGSGLEGKSGNYFAALDASVEALQSRAQSLIDKINEGRSKDQALMKNFNESLTMKVSELSQHLEDRMYHLYDHHNKLLQDRLQELPEIIDRIGKLQAELKQVCQTVVTVYKDLCVRSEI